MWLLAQLAFLGYLVWASDAIESNPYAGMFVAPAILALTFPGLCIALPMLLIPIVLLELLAPSVLGLEWVQLLLALVTWCSSSWLTYRFWQWIAGQFRQRFVKPKTGAPS